MKKICLLGGGHGSSRLIKGFINTENKIDVIVTSSDNGGHTGKLIKEFNVPALGDLRMVLESVLDKPLASYFSYRFKKIHNEDNVSLGNLMLLSMLLEHKDVNTFLDEVNKLIDKNINIHLSNSSYVELNAITFDNVYVEGESNIGESENIKDVYLKEEGIVEDRVIDLLNDADIIVLSFGSFYTSLGAVIANEKIREAIQKTKAKVVYITYNESDTITCQGKRTNISKYLKKGYSIKA